MKLPIGSLSLMRAFGDGAAVQGRCGQHQHM
jgi:hypothetical protein